LAIPFNGQGSGAEESLRKALKMGELYLSQPMTPRMTYLLRDAITCPHKGMFRKLFLESRALELIACHLEQAFLQTSHRSSARPLTPEDRDCITLARDILVDRLQYPPALPDLAREVGMSHTRLTRGFKKLYGCTVFEYLRNKRLSYGRNLLVENQLSITEVAFEAGFSSSSHFAAAFQRVYGVTPSHYRLVDRGRASLA
jgi:AraC-like DNA-binding protein